MRTPSAATAFPRLSMAANYFLILLALAVTAGGAVAVWRGSQGYARERAASEVRDAYSVHALAYSADLFLRGASTAVETLAGEAAALPAQDGENLQPLVRRFAEGNARWFISMYVIGTDGREIADYFPTGKDEAERLSGVGVDLGDRDYFQRTLAERRTVVSQAVIGRSTKRPVVVVSTPIFGKDGAVTAVAAGSLDLQALSQLASYAAGKGETVPWIADAQGQAVVRGDGRRVSTLTDVSGLEPARRALAGQDGIVRSYAGLDGRKEGAAYAPVPEYGWGAWFAHDEASASQAFVDASIRDAVVSFSIVLLLAALTFLFASRLLFSPLRRVTEAVGRIAEGDLDARIDRSGILMSKETFELAERFDDMAERLKASLGVKTKFLDVVAHVFRTPITALRWRMEETTANGMPDALRESMDDCLKSTYQLQMAFDNVLLAQELSQKGLTPSMTAIPDVAALLQEATHQISYIAQAEGVRIRTTAEAGLRMQGDASRVRKIFEVLIANAVYYGERGGEVQSSLSQEGGEIVFRVTDHGIGMTPDERARAFMPFFRGDEAQRKFTGGTGLGLYIAKALAEMHHGTLDLRPSADRGTIATARFPM